MEIQIWLTSLVGDIALRLYADNIIVISHGIRYNKIIGINYLHLMWGTGIRGLMRGMATLPQGNQELLMVGDKIGRASCRERV